MQRIDQSKEYVVKGKDIYLLNEKIKEIRINIDAMNVGCAKNNSMQLRFYISRLIENAKIK